MVLLCHLLKSLKQMRSLNPDEQVLLLRRLRPFFIISDLKLMKAELTPVPKASPNLKCLGISSVISNDLLISIRYHTFHTI